MPILTDYKLPDPAMGTSPPAPTLVMVQSYKVRGGRSTQRRRAGARAAVLASISPPGRRHVLRYVLRPHPPPP
jgi:hypothetical protein